MRAVMQAQDISPAAARIGISFRALYNTIRDRLQARNQPLRRLLPPVSREQRPHCSSVAKFARYGNDPGISLAVGRTKPLWRRSERVSNSVLAETQLDPDLSWATPKQIRMCFRVVTDSMAACGRFFDKVGTFPHKASDQKKSGFRVVAVQKIEKFWRGRRIWPVIKRKRQLARRVRTPDRRPENLRPRINRAVSGNPRRVFKSASSRSTSASRSSRVRRSTVSSVSSSASALATASV